MNGVNGDDFKVESNGEANKERYERSCAMRVFDESLSDGSWRVR